MLPIKCKVARSGTILDSELAFPRAKYANDCYDAESSLITNRIVKIHRIHTRCITILTNSNANSIPQIPLSNHDLHLHPIRFSGYITAL